MHLFELDELVVYAQRPIDPTAAALARELVEDAILGHRTLGPRITNPPQRGIKGLALDVARRSLRNPNDVQSESTDNTSVTYMSTGNRGVDLTDREIDRLRDIVGDNRAYTVPLDDPGLGQRIWPHHDQPWWPR
jgi:hypothetical protein